MFFADGRLLVPLLFLLLLAILALFILSSFLFIFVAVVTAALVVAAAVTATVGRCFPPLLPPTQNPISKSPTSYNILYHRLETLASNSSSVLS